MNAPETGSPRHEPGPSAPTAKWLFAGFLVVAGFFLLTEHQAHLFGALPYLLILACPLMHLFGHRHGHGHHGERPTEAGERRDVAGSP